MRCLPIPAPTESIALKTLDLGIPRAPSTHDRRYRPPMLSSRLLSLSVFAAATAVGPVLVLVAYLAGPVMAVALSGLLAAAATVIARPVIGICGGFLAIPLESLNISVGVAGLSLAELGFVGAAGAVSFQVIVGRARLGGGAEYLLLAALILIAAIGLSFAEDRGVVAKIVLMWSVFALLASYISTLRPRDLTIIATAMIVSGFIVGAMGVMGAGDLQLRAGGTAASNRATGAFNHPNLLAFYLALLTPLAIVTALGSRRWWRVLAAVAALTMLAALLLSLSRGALIGTVVAFGVLAAWRAFRRGALTVMLLVVAFAAINGSAVLASQEVSIISTRVASISGERETNPRLRIYSRTPALIADYPVLGVGVGNFPVWSPRYGMYDRGGSAFLHAHNLPLTIAAELGLAGLAVLVALAFVLVSRSLELLRASNAPFYPLGLGVVAALSAFVAISVTDYVFRSNPITAVLLAEIGLLGAATRLNRATRVRPSG